MNETNETVLRRNFLDMKYARIIELIAEEKHISREEAMDMLYSSPLLPLIDEGVAELDCRSDKYLASEIWREHCETVNK